MILRKVRLVSWPNRALSGKHSVWAACISRWTSREIQPFSRSQQQQRRRQLVSQSCTVPHHIWLLNQVHRRLWIPKQICHLRFRNHVIRRLRWTRLWKQRLVLGVTPSWRMTKDTPARTTRAPIIGVHMTAIIGPAVAQFNQR